MKASNDQYQGALKPLLILSQPWQDITMDLITELPESEGFNTILTVIDRLMKEQHYITCSTNNEGGTSAEYITELLL